MWELPLTILLWILIAYAILHVIERALTLWVERGKTQSKKAASTRRSSMLG